MCCSVVDVASRCTEYGNFGAWKPGNPHVLHPQCLQQDNPASHLQQWCSRTPYYSRTFCLNPSLQAMARLALLVVSIVAKGAIAVSPDMPAAARPGTFDGSARRRSRLSASRVSVALRVSCTSRCLMNIRSGLRPSACTHTHTHSHKLSAKQGGPAGPAVWACCACDRERPRLLWAKFRDYLLSHALTEVSEPFFGRATILRPSRDARLSPRG